MTTLHGTIRSMITEHGVDILTAISFGTKNVAKALEIDDRKGSLDAGRDADILLLDEQLNIRTVMAKGKLMMHQSEIKVKGTFED